MDFELPHWVLESTLSFNSVFNILTAIRELQIITENYNVQTVIDTCFLIFAKSKWLLGLEKKFVKAIFMLLKNNAWLFSKHFKLIKSHLNIYAYILMVFEFDENLTRNCFLILKTLILF